MRDGAIYESRPSCGKCNLCYSMRLTIHEPSTTDLCFGYPVHLQFVFVFCLLLLSGVALSCVRQGALYTRSCCLPCLDYSSPYDYVWILYMELFPSDDLCLILHFPPFYIFPYRISSIGDGVGRSKHRDLDIMRI